MIFTESTIKISNNVSKMDSTIVLYRGDKNVEIRFTILQSPFKYSNTVATNVIESTNASYGQLVIKTPNDKPPIFSEVSATKEGTVLFTITKEMIDEIEELGVYTFQIRLLDENKQSRVTIPPVENGIEIKEPIAIEDDNTTNVVGLAKANYAVATLSDTDTPTFDDNGKYNKTNWNDGDIITNASLNKIEDGIYTTNENVTATKKYVDDKVTVKILPVDNNKNCATNVADLEPHSIYMSPNDAEFLYLGYEKLDGSFSGFCLSGNPHGKFIYTGAKDDTKIEVMLEGICYTAYFKTDTVDPHTEKTVFYLTKNNTTEFTPSNDYEPATKKYVDDNILLEQLPILRIDETNKRIYVNCNNMGTYKKYFVPNKYANVYGFSFIYTNEDSSETEIALIGGAMTRDDFILCARNTDTLFILILGGTYKYKYTKSTKTLEKGLYGYLKIGNTQEYAPTNDYNPATKKYVDDNKITYTISSKVLATVPASDIKIDGEIAVNNISINKDRRYYIEFLGSKKLCSLLVSEEIGNCIICNIGGYIIQAFNNSTNIMLLIELGKNDITTVTFTDLVIYEEEVKYLDNKYLETDLLLQNSISLGRIGDIGAGSSAIGMRAEASGQCSHAEGMYVTSSGNCSHAEGANTVASGDSSHAEGASTIASSQNQHVQGKYNIEDANNKYAHIVGNGEDGKNSNAHTLDWEGNAWFAGKLTQEGTPTEGKDLTTKKYVDDNRDYYFKVPTILYDDPNLPKGYVDISTLETGTNYRVNSSIVSGLFKVSLKALNDDGTWFTVDDGSNTIGWSSMLSTSICVELKSDTFIGINMSSINNYCKYLSITKENGKWKLMQTKLNSISPDNMYEYEVSNDYNPAHKKYVDDKVASLPQLSFNEAGELVVTINGVSKTFVPKNV